MDETKKAARLWIQQQVRLERRALRPLVALGLANAAAGIGQAWCIAVVLASALHGSGVPAGLLAVFGGLALLRTALQLVVERGAHAAGAGARARLRLDAVTRLLRAGPALLRQRHSAELTATVTDRVEALDGLFGRWSSAARLAILSPLLVTLSVLPFDWVAALILAACGLLVPVAMAASGLGAAAASRSQFAAMARLQVRFLDRVRGIATIVLGNGTDREARALAAAADELRGRTMRVLRVAFLSSAALDLAAAAALVILAARYGLVSRQAAWPAARPLAVLLLVPEFFAPLRQFSAAYQDRMQAIVAAEALVALPQPAEDAPAPAAIRTVEAHGVTVTFDNVTLSWDPTRPPALDGLSFRVPAGETLVLAGPSGSGKSSALEILLGFVRPDGGRVTLNGAELDTIVPQALSRLTAWIGQRPVLFAGSIRDNIRFARPEASEDEVLDAARAARVDGFADELPDGLDTRIGDGGHGLSGGQAQRVAIARAFLKNAPLLLLDEPTTHLDPATEREVLDSLRRLALGRTVILASHSAAAQGFSGRRLDIAAGRAASARGVA